MTSTRATCQNSEFDTDTLTEPLADNRYRATITDRWDQLGGSPNGGYLLAVGLQALRHAMPFPDPLVVSTFYLRRGLYGPVEIQTDIARVGTRIATGEASVFQNGKEILRMLASFGDLGQATGRTLVLGEPPQLPPPHECVDPTGGNTLPGVTIAERVEYRMPELPGWMQGQPTGQPSTAFWMRLTDGRDADLFTLPLMVDAAAPAVLEIGELGSVTLELTVHMRARPAAGWLACRVSTRHVIGGYHEEDCEIWDSHGALVAQSRQLALLPGAVAG